MAQDRRRPSPASRAATPGSVPDRAATAPARSYDLRHARELRANLFADLGRRRRRAALADRRRCSRRCPAQPSGPARRKPLVTMRASGVMSVCSPRASAVLACRHERANSRMQSSGSTQATARMPPTAPRHEGRVERRCRSRRSPKSVAVPRQRRPRTAPCRCRISFIPTIFGCSASVATVSGVKVDAGRRRESCRGAPESATRRRRRCSGESAAPGVSAS